MESGYSYGLYGPDNSGSCGSDRRAGGRGQDLPDARRAAAIALIYLAFTKQVTMSDYGLRVWSQPASSPTV